MAPGEPEPAEAGQPAIHAGGQAAGSGPSSRALARPLRAASGPSGWLAERVEGCADSAGAVPSCATEQAASALSHHATRHSVFSPPPSQVVTRAGVACGTDLVTGSLQLNTRPPPQRLATQPVMVTPPSFVSPGLKP
jgi:hypothetical protein